MVSQRIYIACIIKGHKSVEVRGDRRDVFVGSILCSQHSGKGIQALADRNEIARVIRRERGHSCIAMRLNLNEPLSRESTKRLPERGGAHSEVFRKRALTDNRSRIELTAKNAPTQFLVGVDVLCGGEVQRLRHLIPFV